jgi:hypothetical protein
MVAYAPRLDFNKHAKAKERFDKRDLISPDMAEELFEALYAFQAANLKNTPSFSHITFYEHVKNSIGGDACAKGTYASKAGVDLFDFEITDGPGNGSQIIAIHFTDEWQSLAVIKKSHDIAQKMRFRLKNKKKKKAGLIAAHAVPIKSSACIS